ncbi:MAG TPA: dihydropteroate synthase, partial [Nitrospirales bacterium]|nr:dihydropteroate synthase [Nitrospirales bacterium]
ELEEEGADVIDIGGESTRPGVVPTSLEEECRRVLPVIEQVAKRDSCCENSSSPPTSHYFTILSRSAKGY